MADFSSATKYLTITPSTKDMSRSEKYTTLVPARAIKRLQTKFLLTAQQAGVFTTPRNRLAWQYNFTAQGNFVIVNYKALRNLLRRGNIGQIALRWRNGSTVTRYVLQQYELAYYRPLNLPLYAGEIIPSNFVIEVWNSRVTAVAPFGVAYDTYITGSYLTVPETPDDTESVIEYTALEQTELFQSIPETLPTTYGTESAWLDND